MKTNIYVNDENFVAGMTMKDAAELEDNNMALHICENSAHVVENRKKLAASLHCELNDFVCAQQTHSANFHQVTLADKGRGADRMESAIPDTDALYTYEPNLVVCSFTADCVPVIFYNEVEGLVGVIHSGWQGTVKEITLKLFEHLVQVEQCAQRISTSRLAPHLARKSLKSMQMYMYNSKTLAMRMISSVLMTKLTNTT